MSAAPLISVLMPVNNGEKYLNEAIESILHQKYKNYEFVIVNDGSTDNTDVIIESFQLQDQRIRICHQRKQGLISALNTGLNLCQGKYIARMDADDVSLPERLGKQVTFMEEHPQVGVCGTWVQTIGTVAGQTWPYPADDAALRCQLLFRSPLAHPAVMMRRETLIKTRLRYSQRDAEDYALWVHLAQHSQLANIPQVLLFYRTHSQQTMQQHLSVRRAADKQVRLWLLKNLGIQPSTEELDLHQAISLVQIQPNQQFITRAGSWLEKLQRVNNEQLRYPEPEFSNVLGEWWFRTCRTAFELGWWVWRKFWASPLSQNINLHPRTKIKFGVLCAIKQKRTKT